jgi:mono/diheme cytochrome c family protein
MPAWTRLSDAEISAIGNFVLQKLNGMKVNVPEGTIKEARAAAPDLITLKHLRDGS